MPWPDLTANDCHHTRPNLTIQLSLGSQVPCRSQVPCLTKTGRGRRRLPITISTLPLLPIFGLHHSTLLKPFSSLTNISSSRIDLKGCSMGSMMAMHPAWRQ